MYQRTTESLKMIHDIESDASTLVLDVAAWVNITYPGPPRCGVVL